MWTFAAETEATAVVRLAALCVATLLFLSPARAQQQAPELSLEDRDYVEIGSLALDGSSEASFSTIAGAMLLPSGGIAVADGGNLDIRWFDASGTHLQSVGREGEGPGEFRSIHWIGACPGGEILVVDPLVGRGSFLSAADGDVVRSVPAASTLRWNKPLSCRGDGQLLVLMESLDGGKIEPYRDGRVTPVRAEVVRFGLTSGVDDTLRVLSGSDYYSATTVAVFSPVPLGARALGAVGGGRLYAAQSDADSIRVMDLDSGEWTSFAHGLPREPVTRGAWDQAVSEFVWRQPREDTRRVLARAFEEAPAPETLPAFLAMRADPAGRVWLQIPGGAAEGSRWKIFDHDGRPVATMTFPSDVEPIDIGQERVAALERGPLDVPLIRVYQLPDLLSADSTP